MRSENGRGLPPLRYRRHRGGHLFSHIATIFIPCLNFWSARATFDKGISRRGIVRGEARLPFLPFWLAMAGYLPVCSRRAFIPKLSQNQLSQLTGIPQATISAIEHGRVRLGIERAKVLARALKCHPSVLVFPGWELPDEAAKTLSFNEPARNSPLT